MRVLAYHCIISTYGFWLPNDPRGSWSEVVRRFDLLKYGAPSKVSTRRSVANKAHDQKKRKDAKEALKHEPVLLTGKQAQLVGTAFHEFALKSQLLIYALAIMPDHVHIVVGRNDTDIRQTIDRMKQAATVKLRAIEAKNSPMQVNSPWARGSWNVYLFKPEAVVSAIQFVEENPLRAGLQKQRWKVVRAFEG